MQLPPHPSPKKEKKVKKENGGRRGGIYFSNKMGWVAQVDCYLKSSVPYDLF